MKPVAGSLDAAAKLVCVLAEHALTSVCSPPETVRRRETTLASIDANELPIAVVELPSARARLANLAWRQLFESASGDPLSRVPDAVWTQVRALAPDAELHYPDLALAADGPPHHVAIIARTLHDGSGAIAGAVLVAADTTDAVVAESVGASPDDLVWSGPIGGDADYVNAAWRAYTGDVAVTGPWLHEQDRARCAHALAKAGRARTSSSIDVRLRAASGAYRWHVVRFFVGDSRWHGIAHDMDEARQVAMQRDELMARERAARADAEQANRLKDQFLAAVSHELRAPLTAMLLWEKVLRDNGETAEMHAKALEAIRVSAQTQSRIVGDLLDVSRAVSGKLHVDLRPVEIARVIDDVIAAAAPLAAAKQVTLRRQGGSALGEVQGDAPRLHQVLENLLSNAIKFTDAGGEVTVTVGRQSRNLTISVADTGRGITGDALTRIFEPFTQFDGELTRSAGGLGLGLAIAKQLVELHHGRLTVASEGLGRGSTFTVTLPVARSRRAQSPAPGVDVARLQGCTILVVDDDARVCEALQALLARTGAEVRTACDAEAGRQRISERVPDIVICDIAMPGEDGYTLIASLRARGVHSAAIALTAHASRSAALRAIESGFDRHVAKPVDIEKLIGVLHELMPSRP